MASVTEKWPTIVHLVLHLPDLDLHMIMYIAVVGIFCGTSDMLNLVWLHFDQSSEHIVEQAYNGCAYGPAYLTLNYILCHLYAGLQRQHSTDVRY